MSLTSFLLLFDSPGTAGVDGYVEYALNADEGPWARIDFRSILTNVNELNVVITDESYEPRSDFNEEGALVGTCLRIRV